MLVRAYFFGPASPSPKEVVRGRTTYEEPLCDRLFENFGCVIVILGSVDNGCLGLATVQSFGD